MLRLSERSFIQRQPQQRGDCVLSMHKQMQEYKEKLGFTHKTTLLEAVVTIMQYQDWLKKKAEEESKKLLRPDPPTAQMF